MTKSTGVGRGANGGNFSQQLWMPAMDEVIREQAAAGARPEDVATLLAQLFQPPMPKFTRASVLGRGHRLKPKVRWAHGRGPYKKRTPQKITRPKHDFCGVAPPAVPVAPNDPPPPSLGIPLTQLNGHHCRWPYGERAPYEFCGHPQLLGSSYCPYHDAKALRT